LRALSRAASAFRRHGARLKRGTPRLRASISTFSPRERRRRTTARPAAHARAPAGGERAEAQQLRGDRGVQGRRHPRLVLVDSVDGPRPPPLPNGPSTKEGRSTFFTPDIIVPVSPATIG
jgi:hypothetical protein